MHEGDEPDAVVDFFDSQGLPGEHLTEIDFLASETDSTACCDGDPLVVEGIFELRQALVGAGVRDDRGRRERPC